MNADGAVGGADGDLANGGGGYGGRSECKFTCGSLFESIVVGGYRTFC